MADTIGTAFVFFILLVGGAIAFGSLIKTKDLSMGNCNMASNGTLENCSLSNNDYKMLNDSYSQSITTFTTFSSLNWVTGLAVVVVVLLGLAVAIKK